jgi:hypothetical protein
MPAPASWVSKTPGVCGGDACIHATRATVWGLVEWRRLGLSDAEILRHVTDRARDLENEPVILTREGKPVAALTSLENIDWESISLSTNPQFIALIERIRAQQAAEGGYASEEVRQMFGLQKQT